MKKLFLTAAVALTLSTGAFADGSVKSTSETNVSYQILNQFDVQFSGAENVQWSATSVGTKAEFVLDDVKMSAFYDNHGQFIGTTESVAFKKIPLSAKKEIAEKYKGYFVGDVIKFQSAETSNGLDRLVGETDSVAYFVDLKNDKEEFLLRVTPQGNIYFYKQIK